MDVTYIRAVLCIMNYNLVMALCGIRYTYPQNFSIPLGQQIVVSHYHDDEYDLHLACRKKHKQGGEFGPKLIYERGSTKTVYGSSALWLVAFCVLSFELLISYVESVEFVEDVRKSLLLLLVIPLTMAMVLPCMISVLIYRWFRRKRIFRFFSLVLSEFR